MAKERKINWRELQEFWTKNFGLEADDVFQVLYKEYFDKNWLGTKEKIGRVWMFKEHREELQFFIHQVEALAKKKEITFRKSALALYDYHQELEDKRLLKNNPYGRLIVFCTLPHLKRKNFDNLLNIWKQLPFINLKKTISYKQKQLHHAAKKVLSREQKEKILRKKYS